MKKRKYISAVLLASIFLITKPDSTVQGQTGVFLTYADYKNGNLCYGDDCYLNDFHKGKFRFNELLGKKYLTIIGNYEKIKLDKEKIFAIQLCNGALIRFQKGQLYMLAEAEEGAFNIYYKEEMKAENKTIYLVRNYFFSTKPEGQILPLTLENLIGAYPENLKFHRLLYYDSTYGDNDLTSYDSQKKMYRVNKLFLDSL
jgi:hypothetical protein